MSPLLKLSISPSRKRVMASVGIDRCGTTFVLGKGHRAAQHKHSHRNHNFHSLIPSHAI